jgi:hypothetical protein
MRASLILLLLLLANSVGAVQAQVLAGDPAFSLLHRVRWGMPIHEIRMLYEGKQKLEATTDSTLTISTKYFDAPASTEIQFQRSRRGPALIRIRFDEPSKALVDTISNHLSQFLRTSPVVTATEKKLFTISLRIEIAKWKTEKESIILTTALRDGVIGDVGLIISMLAD